MKLDHKLPLMPYNINFVLKFIYKQNSIFIILTYGILHSVPKNSKKYVRLSEWAKALENFVLVSEREQPPLNFELFEWGSRWYFTFEGKQKQWDRTQYKHDCNLWSVTEKQHFQFIHENRKKWVFLMKILAQKST